MIDDPTAATSVLTLNIEVIDKYSYKNRYTYEVNKMAEYKAARLEKYVCKGR